jgi:hypothetical protein
MTTSELQAEGHAQLIDLPLLMCRLAFNRQSEAKVCAARRVISGPQATAVLFDDGAADRQTYADTMRLRGEERIENLVDRQRR